MATGAAGDGLFWRVFGGCICADDMGIQRRPYHRNCSCALHNSGGSHCSHVAKVSYPMRRSWTEVSMVAMMSTVVATASPGSSLCCSSSLKVAAPATIKDPPHGPNHHQ